MDTSQFMDKQIMDLSNSQNNNKGKDDFIDLINHPRQEDHHPQVRGGGAKKDEMLPNYDFQPIRPFASSQQSNIDSNNAGGTRVWSSAESKANSGIRNYGFIDSLEPAKVNTDKDRDAYDAALISEIDRTMKKHADNLMHALEGVSARLSQLENRSRYLESSVDDLKASVGNNHGSTDGKLRQIENTIREVQAGVQVVKDKHEILEAKLQLSKVQISKAEQLLETQIPRHMESMQQAAASAPLQSHHQLPPSAHTQSLPPTLPNTPPPPIPLNLAPPVQHPNQFPQNITPIPQHDSYYQPSSQTPEAPPQQQLQPLQMAPPSPQGPQPQYQPPRHTQFSQPPPLPQHHASPSSANPTQSQPPVGHHSDEPPYLQSQSYLPSVHQPGGVPPPSQKFYVNPSQMYEPPSSRPGSGFSSQYGPSAGHGEPYPYGGSPSQYGGGSPIKSQRHSSPNIGPSSESGYPQIPTAKILPHAIPTASGVGGGSGSGSGSSSSNSGNRVPIDDVVDKVTNMGFPRDQVKATVRKLTENGQAVDLNVVLDKLMTDGVESQGPNGWFGR